MHLRQYFYAQNFIELIKHQVKHTNKYKSIEVPTQWRNQTFASDGTSLRADSIFQDSMTEHIILTDLEGSSVRAQEVCLFG